MNTATLFSLLMLAFMGAILLLVPQFAPRRYFFAVTVPPGFRTSEAGQAAARRYHWWVIRGLAGSAAVVALLAQTWPNLAFGIAPLLATLSAAAAFLRERSRLRNYAAPPPGVREADLAPDGDHLPSWILLAVPPFALPLAGAAWLRAHWREIPARFPVHWNAAGEPNRWASKTPVAVYGPLLTAGIVMLLLLLLGLGIFYGARRAPQRSAILKILVACVYFLGLMLTGVGLLPLLKIPLAFFIVPVVLLVAAVVAWGYRIVTDPSFPVETTLDDYWHAGVFYCNPEDPAIFVQKRIGFGYTFNFGNRLSWLILGAFAAGLVGLALARL